MSRRWALACWAIVAAVLPGACETNDGNIGPLDDQIVATIRQVWEGIGVDPDEPHLYGYNYQTRPSSKSCQHLAEDDRWYAERASEMGRPGVSQAELHTTTIAYFKEAGYTVERWHTSAPDAPVDFGLIAHQDETAIKITIGDTASTLLSVRMGPCATPTLDGFTQPLYTPDGPA